MRKIPIIVSILYFAAVFVTVVSWAGEVAPSKDGKLSGGKFGEVYQCAFPNTVELDGKLNDFAWQYAPWHTIENDDGTAPAPNAKDATIAFAAVADNQWLYVALKVTDDKIVTGEEPGASAWKDDSVEIYIDANHGETATFEKDDAQITIPANNINLKNIEKPELGGTGDGATTGTQVAVVETDDGWIVESAIPLKNDKWNIKLANGTIIGFNIHLNDDDDGGDRDHKLIWSLKDVDDQSWQNTTRFANLEFVNVQLAVNSNGKLTAIWGDIKRYQKIVEETITNRGQKLPLELGI